MIILALDGAAAMMISRLFCVYFQLGVKGSVSPCGLAEGCCDGGRGGERGEAVIGVNTVAMTLTLTPPFSFWLYTQSAQVCLVCSLGDSSVLFPLGSQH